MIPLSFALMISKSFISFLLSLFRLSDIILSIGFNLLFLFSKNACNQQGENNKEHRQGWEFCHAVWIERGKNSPPIREFMFIHFFLTYQLLPNGL